MSRQISPERKTIYYIGIALVVIGAISFFSVFVTDALNFGNFDNFKSRASFAALRSVFGMALMVVGGVCMFVGARGLAGAGVVLDPEKAREDVEPYSRMAGGIVKDALDEADIDTGPK